MIKHSRFPRRVLLEVNTQCNLKCKMCFVHSANNKSLKKPSKAIMPLHNLEKILEEMNEIKPLIHPELYAEVLLSPNFKDVIKLIKSKGMAVAVNTNGTLVNEDMCHFFLDAGIDSINFSLNALTEDTYKAIHGVNKLTKVNDSIIRLLEIRGDSYSPRIGVSFVRQEENIGEENDFIEYWSQYVDVIRLSASMSVVKHDDYKFLPLPKTRTPCKMLYETIPILNNGDVCLCCRDYDGKYIMGNVFNESVEAVWNGPVFQKFRKLHEEGAWDEIPICSQCDGWAWLGYEEEVTDNFLIRRSPIETYYNVKERLQGWETAFLGGHKKPILQ